MTSAGEPDPVDSRGASRLDLDALVRIDVGATALFVVASVAAAAFPDVVQVPYAAFSLVLFAIGIVAFVWAYVVAIGRSRYEYLSTTGIYFLTGGVVDRPVRRRLMGALALQCLAAVVAASFQVFTPVAFGTLAPMFGLGLAGLAGARFGRYEARPDPSSAPTPGEPGEGEPRTRDRRGSSGR